jgi:hypothetical protein
MREILKPIALVITAVLISAGLIYLTDMHQRHFQPKPCRACGVYSIQQTPQDSASVQTDQKLVVPPSATVRLPPGQKLVQYDYAPKTGFYHEFSYLTRGMRPGETPETYSLVRMSENSVVPNAVVLLIEQAPIRAESDTPKPASTAPDPTRK